MLNFLRHHWYDFGVVSGVITTYYLNQHRRTVTTTQKILLVNFLAIIVHQFEEYRFPGGFPAAMNTGVHRSTHPDRYPLNAHSALITNVVATYGLYLPAIFCPDRVWFALASVIIGFGQILIHGLNINSKMGAFYNPGLASAVLLHVPVGIYYIRHINATGQLTGRQLVLGLISGLLVAYLLLAKYTFTWAPDYNAPYPFTVDEMERGGVASWLENHSR